MTNDFFFVWMVQYKKNTHTKKYEHRKKSKHKKHTTPYKCNIARTPDIFYYRFFCARPSLPPSQLQRTPLPSLTLLPPNTPRSPLCQPLCEPSVHKRPITRLPPTHSLILIIPSFFTHPSSLPTDFNEHILD